MEVVSLSSFCYYLLLVSQVVILTFSNAKSCYFRLTQPSVSIYTAQCKCLHWAVKVFTQGSVRRNILSKQLQT